MKISRAPFRVSFFGGGTDFKEWYSENTSTIVSVSIDKYCYVTMRELLPFYGNKYRVSWSKIENANDIEYITHPSIRECLRYKNIREGVEIHTDGDLPARSGLGSSSSFTVALLHACNRLKNEEFTKQQMALEAIHVEQELLKETVGLQDQIQTCYGGFNIIKIAQSGEYNIINLSKDNKIIREIEASLVLVYSNVQRISSLEQKHNKSVKGDHVERRKQSTDQIHEISNYCARLFLEDKMDIKRFCECVNESWQAKQNTLSDTKNNRRLINLYKRGIEAGAWAGKCLGAGGGGFLAFLVNSEIQTEFKKKMDPYICIKPCISERGVHSIL